MSEGAVNNPRMPVVLAAGGRAATTLGSTEKGVTRRSLHFITILLLGVIYFYLLDVSKIRKGDFTSLFYFNYLFIYLAALGLSWGLWDLVP